MLNRIGKWTIPVILVAAIQLSGPHSPADAKRHSWESKIDDILVSLSKNIDAFEELQTRMAELSRTNENYSEQKTPGFHRH